jgi:hypothetical protein
MGCCHRNGGSCPARFPARYLIHFAAERYTVWAWGISTKFVVVWVREGVGVGPAVGGTTTQEVSEGSPSLLGSVVEPETSLQLPEQ